MFYILSKIFGFLTKPLVWIFILMVSSLLFKRKRNLFLILSVLMFYFFSNQFIADKCALIWEISPISIKNINKKYDYGVVLGGYSSYNKEVEQIDLNNHADRLITAIELYHLGIIKKILISGGNGNLINNGLKESIWSYNLLITMKVHKKDIILESKSRNTMENALYSSSLINPQKNVLLVTSANHMKRAEFCFNKMNIPVDCFPTDCTKRNKVYSLDYLFIPSINALLKWKNITHEIIGYFKYQLKY